MEIFRRKSSLDRVNHSANRTYNVGGGMGRNWKQTRHWCDAEIHVNKWNGNFQKATWWWQHHFRPKANWKADATAHRLIEMQRQALALIKKIYADREKLKNWSGWARWHLSVKQWKMMQGASWCKFRFTQLSVLNPSRRKPQFRWNQLSKSPRLSDLHHWMTLRHRSITHSSPVTSTTWRD